MELLYFGAIIMVVELFTPQGQQRLRTGDYSTLNLDSVRNCVESKISSPVLKLRYILENYYVSLTFPGKKKNY